MRNAVAAGEERVQKVERYRALPDLERHLVNGLVLLQRAARAVEEDVEPAETLDRRRDRARDRFVACHVGMDEQRGIADFTLRALAGFAVYFRERNSRAFAHVSLRRRFGDARAAAREKCNFAVESAQGVLRLYCAFV